MTKIILGASILLFGSIAIADIIATGDTSFGEGRFIGNVTTGRVSVGAKFSGNANLKGTLEVNDGSVLTSNDGPVSPIGVPPGDDSEPGGMIGRGSGSDGLVTITGPGSMWRLEGTGEDSGVFFGPYLLVGRDGGHGELHITAGGKVILDGLGSTVGADAAANVKIGRDPAAIGSELEISGFGSEMLIDNIDHTQFRMGNGNASLVNITDQGKLTVAGDNSIAQIQWGDFNVITGGTVTTNLATIGNRQNSNATVNIDGLNSSIHLTGVGTATNEWGNAGFGGFMTIGRGENSIAEVNVTNGAELNIDSGITGLANDGTASSGSGFSLGGSTSSTSGQGTLNVTTDSRVTVSGGGEFVGLGRNQTGTGIINVNTGGQVLIVKNTDSTGVLMAPNAESGTAELNVDGLTSLFDAGKFLGVGVDGGSVITAKADVSTCGGGTVKASEIVVGGGGIIKGDGTLTYDTLTLNGGSILPGCSPGTLTFDGDFIMNDGVLEIEVAGTGPGQFDVLNVVNGSANLIGGTILFSFIDGFLPQEDDPLLEFVAADSGLTIGNTVDFAFQGVDESFELAVVSDGLGLKLDPLNNALPPSGVVLIDIKPRNKKNKINPRSRGKIWVAILSDARPFDPLQVKISSVAFGPDGARAIRHHVRDVNRDGSPDLLLRFKIRETGIACGDSEAILIGETWSGESITGSDSVKTVDCKKNSSDDDDDGDDD